MTYIVPILVVAFGVYMIYMVYQQSSIRHVESVDFQIPLENESVILKTQEIQFDIRSYPVLPGFLLLRNTSPVYYIDRQQIVLTNKRIIVSAVVNNKKYAPKAIYFQSSDLLPEVLKYSRDAYVYDSHSIKSNQLQITSKEKKAFFPLPAYITVNFSKYPAELLKLLEQNNSKGVKS